MPDPDLIPVHSLCLRCKEPFKAARFWQRFCSKRCHDLFHKQEAALARAALMRERATQELS